MTRAGDFLKGREGPEGANMGQTGCAGVGRAPKGFKPSGWPNFGLRAAGRGDEF